MLRNDILRVCIQIIIFSTKSIIFQYKNSSFSIQNSSNSSNSIKIATLTVLLASAMWLTWHVAQTISFREQNLHFSTGESSFLHKTDNLRMGRQDNAESRTNGRLLLQNVGGFGLQSERDLSIAGMYIQCNQREIYQSPACISKAGSINRVPSDPQPGRASPRPSSSTWVAPKASFFERRIFIFY